MKKFELVKIGNVGVREIEAYRCLDESHLVKMNEEEAMSRGLMDKWSPVLRGVRAQVFASVTPIDVRVLIPRKSRRDKVVKVKGTLIRCDKCGYSENVFVVSPGDFLFENARREE